MKEIKWLSCCLHITLSKESDRGSNVLNMMTSPYRHIFASLAFNEGNPMPAVGFLYFDGVSQKKKKTVEQKVAFAIICDAMSSCDVTVMSHLFSNGRNKTSNIFSCFFFFELGHVCPTCNVAKDPTVLQWESIWYGKPKRWNIGYHVYDACRSLMPTGSKSLLASCCLFH